MLDKIVSLQNKKIRKWLISTPDSKKSQKKRLRVPMHIRVLVWRKYCGNVLQGGRCVACGEPLDFKDASFSHKVPRCRGGSIDARNIIPLHRRCNEDMGDMTAIEYIRKFYPKREKILRKKGFL